MAEDAKSSQYVTLVSNDGYEFKILRSAACIAGTIKKALDPTSGFRETTQNRVDLPTINGVVLEKVCEYLYYNQKHLESKDVSDMDIPPELCLELLIAADYLDGVNLAEEDKMAADVTSMILDGDVTNVPIHDFSSRPRNDVYDNGTMTQSRSLSSATPGLSAAAKPSDHRKK